MEEKYTQEMINRFIIKLKADALEKLCHEAMPGQCKTTTSEETWKEWKKEFPDAEFSTRQIGERIYFMIA